MKTEDRGLRMEEPVKCLALPGCERFHSKAPAAVARTLWRAEEDWRSPRPAVAQPLWRGEPGGGSVEPRMAWMITLVFGNSGAFFGGVGNGN